MLTWCRRIASRQQRPVPQNPNSPGVKAFASCTSGKRGLISALRNAKTESKNPLRRSTAALLFAFPLLQISCGKERDKQTNGQEFENTKIHTSGPCEVLRCILLFFLITVWRRVPVQGGASSMRWRRGDTFAVSRQVGLRSLSLNCIMSTTRGATVRGSGVGS